MIHWWSGDGTGDDLVGDQPLSPVGIGSFLNGVGEQAFHLFGKDDWWQAPPDRAWDLGDQDFTFAACLWLDHLEPTGNLLGNVIPESDGNHGRWTWEVQEQQLRFFTSRGAGTNGTIVAGPGFDPLAHRWYHLALTRHGPQFNFFINGRLRASVTNAVTTPPEPGPLAMGPLSTGARLDEVQWYHRALGTNEVQSLFRAGGSYVKAPQLIFVGTTSAGGLKLRADGVARLPLRLEYSGDLRHWTLHPLAPASGETAEIEVPPEAGDAPRFYRLVPVP